MRIERSALNDRRRNGIACVAIATVVALAAFVGGRMTAPESSHGEERAPAGGPTVPTAAATKNRIAGTPTSDGAVTAATKFARIMGSIRSGDTGYIDALVEIAAPDWRDDARRLAENGLTFVRERYGTDGAVTFEPIRYKLVEFDNERATVAIWGVVLSNSTGPIDATWGTGTIELNFVEGQWRMAGGESTPGPTPHQLKPEDSAPVSALNGFSEYSDGPQS